MCKDDEFVVIVFSFGSKGTKGNSCLGVTAAAYAQIKRASFVVTQKDIPNIPNSAGDFEFKYGDDFFCKFFYAEDFMKEEGWHSTLWVANATKIFCLSNLLPLKAIVIAAPMHLRRAVRDTRRSGFEVVGAISPLTKMGWYEKKSLLPWTRSWWRWWIREIPLRLLPWWLYKRLTLKS